GLARPTRFANLDLVPAKADLAGAVVELARRGDGERYLAQSLARAREPYSFVFLDCPPSLGPLTVNALAAADRVLVPVQAEYYALEGLSQLVESVELIRRRLNPRLGIGGVLLTMVDARTKLASDVESEVRRHFGELVFKQSVPRSVRLAEAPSHGLPAIAYDRRSAGAPGGGAGPARRGAGAGAASRCPPGGGGGGARRGAGPPTPPPPTRAPTARKPSLRQLSEKVPRKALST